MKLPKYRKHSTRDFGFVQWKKKRIRLPGKYGSHESRTAYAKFIADLKSPVRTGARISYLEDLMLAYLLHARQYYGDHPRSTYRKCRLSVELLIGKKPKGSGLSKHPIPSFGPRALKKWRDELIERGFARITINDHVANIKRAFKWAASEELVDVGLHQALSTVPGLARGRSAAHDPPKRTPVPWEHVEPVLSSLTDPVATMLYFQWLTGCRSGSLVEACPSQFRSEGDLMIWTPRHKTEYQGTVLEIPVGPIGQMVICRLLERDPSKPIFSPREGRFGRHTRYNDKFSSWTYRKRIVRTQDKLGVPHWTPHQLRHARGNQVRQTFGIEAAQGFLGHASLKASEIYSSRRLELAKDVARSIG